MQRKSQIEIYSWESYLKIAGERRAPHRVDRSGVTKFRYTWSLHLYVYGPSNDCHDWCLILGELGRAWDRCVGDASKELRETFEPVWEYDTIRRRRSNDNNDCEHYRSHARLDIRGWGHGFGYVLQERHGTGLLQKRRKVAVGASSHKKYPMKKLIKKTKSIWYLWGRSQLRKK